MLALPLLERTCKADPETADGPAARRMLLVSNNLGVLPQHFFPGTAGRNYEPSLYLRQLQDFRDSFTVFSGLSHPAVEGGHSTENCFLTAAKHPTSSGFRNSISLDRFAAEQLGQQTRFDTLNLGVNIDKANRSLSWTRDGVLLPAEDSAAKLFRKMFVQGTKTETENRLHQLRRRGSILDAVSESTGQLNSLLGRNDRVRLDQYFTSIRELEERLYTAGEWEKRPRPETQQPEPQDITDRSLFFDKFDQMLSVATLALQSDSSRIITLMVDAFATPVFTLSEEEKSVTGYHNLSHHGMRENHIAQLKQADLRQMLLLRKLLTSLSELTDEKGSLLDSTMVLYGSNMGDANTHDNTNLPVLLAGGGFQHGQHLTFDRNFNTPLSKVFVSMLQQMGIETDTFASGNGTLKGLE